MLVSQRAHVDLTSEMSAGTAPGIFTRIANPDRSDRIHFNVPCHCQQILFIHGKRGEPFLPEMPTPLFAAIDAPGTPSIGLPDGAGKTFRTGGHGNEVDMVRHQAPGSNGDVLGTAPFCHQFDVGEIILVAKEGLLTAIPPLGDVVWRARGYDSCDSCHGSTLAEPVHRCQFKYTVP